MAEETKKPAAKKAAPKAAKKTVAKKTTEKVEKKTEVKSEKAAPKAKKAVKAPKAEKVEKVEKVEEKKAVKAEKVEKKVEEAPKAPVTEAVCFVRDVRVTPRKARFVADYVRGMDVEEALAVLKHLNKSAALPIYKAIKSAAANATNNFGMDGEKLYVAEIQASDGMRMKRFTPRAKGSASPVIKRMSNIRVVVKMK